MEDQDRPLNPEGRAQRRVVYEGWVQGVGFRATVASLARAFPVAGWVRNLSDGRVELLALGEASAVEAFLEAVGDRLGRWIQEARVIEESAVENEQAGFTIRYD